MLDFPLFHAGGKLLLWVAVFDLSLKSQISNLKSQTSLAGIKITRRTQNCEIRRAPKSWPDEPSPPGDELYKSYWKEKKISTENLPQRERRSTKWPGKQAV
jgi:hypothetical protein